MRLDFSTDLGPTDESSNDADGLPKEGDRVLANLPLYPALGGVEAAATAPGADDDEEGEEEETAPPPPMEPPSLLKGRGDRRGEDGASLEQAESGDE